MSDDPRGCILAALFAMLFAVAVWGLTYTAVNASWDQELVKRELKAYDTKTGKLYWTEKAGGEAK